MTGSLQEVGEVFTMVLIWTRWRMESEGRKPGTNPSFDCGFAMESKYM